MDNNSDGISMLLQQVQILLDLLLAKLISPLGAHLGERPLGGFVPGGEKKDITDDRQVFAKPTGFGLDRPDGFCTFMAETRGGWRVVVTSRLQTL